MEHAATAVSLKKKMAGYEKSLPILFALMSAAISKQLQKKSREG